MLDLQTLAAEAGEVGAVILNALHGELGDNGFLQSFLEQKDVQVLHTGSDWQITALCHDKVPLPHTPSHQQHSLVVTVCLCVRACLLYLMSLACLL